MNNIVRKIKLSKLGCYQIKDDELELFKWIEYNLLNLEIEQFDNNTTNFHINQKLIFQYFKDLDHIRISYYWIYNIETWRIFTKIHPESNPNNQYIINFIYPIIKGTYKIDIQKNKINIY